ncbi:ABC-2 type transport system ATP-binding protein [Actinopolyspora lacussalsi]|nr:ABC-2 type transport system ATP-binding protein [Actinopolyspora lacussalsi]
MTDVITSTTPVTDIGDRCSYRTVPVGSRLGDMFEEVVNVDRVRCSYGSFEAVRGVRFDIRAGELFALLGTNGAGKTTLLETVEGLRPATEGSVRVFGKDPWRQRAEVRPRTGIMLQQSGFAGELTVLETARLWRAMLPNAKDPRTALETVGLRHRERVRVKLLSGGERRRLDLALATLARPELLFLDEPTSGLDPESRRASWELVAGLLAEGTTVLLTTHYLEEAERLAHRLAIMHRGGIALSGTLSEVLSAESARIRFSVSARAPGLPELAGEVERDDTGRVDIRTESLQPDLHRVLDWSREHGIHLSGLRARQASLEDVFHAVRESDGRPGRATQQEVKFR